MLASEPDSDELSPNHLIAWLFSPKTEEALLGSDLRLFLALFPGMPPTTCVAYDLPGPWENAFRETLETPPLQHSFQDANYHDQIVNERKRADDGRSHCQPVGGNRCPGKVGSAATDPKLSGGPFDRQAPGKIRAIQPISAAEARV